jgi:primosomal protein N' (replication factor Y)
VTGPRAAVVHFTGGVEKQLETSGVTLRTAGPAPLLLTGLPAPLRTGEDVRTLLFFPYGQAGTVASALRAAKAAAAAKRSEEPVQVRLDGVDVL